jgi:hypothetical protein
MPGEGLGMDLPVVADFAGQDALFQEHEGFFRLD